MGGIAVDEVPRDGVRLRPRHDVQPVGLRVVAGGHHEDGHFALRVEGEKRGRFQAAVGVGRGHHVHQRFQLLVVQHHAHPGAVVGDGHVDQLGLGLYRGTERDISNLCYVGVQVSGVHRVFHTSTSISKPFFVTPFTCYDYINSLNLFTDTTASSPEALTTTAGEAIAAT